MEPKLCLVGNCQDDAEVDARYCYSHLCVGPDDDDSWCGRRKKSSADQCPACACTWVFKPGGCDSDNDTVGERCEYPVEGDNGSCQNHDPPCSMCQDFRATRAWEDGDEQDVCADCYQSFSWMRKSNPKPTPKLIPTNKPLVVSADGTRLVSQDDSPIQEVQRGTKRGRVA